MSSECDRMLPSNDWSLTSITDGVHHRKLVLCPDLRSLQIGTVNSEGKIDTFLPYSRSSHVQIKPLGVEAIESFKFLLHDDSDIFKGHKTDLELL